MRPRRNILLDGSGAITITLHLGNFQPAETGEFSTGTDSVEVNQIESIYVIGFDEEAKAVSAFDRGNRLGAETVWYRIKPELYSVGRG
jgi:hypothetical protein